MEDFRDNPEQSPLAWCPWEQKLVKVVCPGQVMKTVFYVSAKGIYPYVTREWHEQTSKQNAIAPTFRSKSTISQR